MIEHVNSVMTRTYTVLSAAKEGLFRTGSAEIEGGSEAARKLSVWH